MAEILKRKYVIPLRKEGLKVAKYNKSVKAVKTVKNFLKKHMKVESVELGKHLNDKIFERGYKNPPSKVEIEAVKLEEKDKGIFVKAELAGFPLKEEKAEVKEEKKEEIKVPLREEPKEVKAVEEEKKEEKEKKEEEKILEKPLTKKEKKYMKIPPEMKKETQEQEEKHRHEFIISKTGKKGSRESTTR